MARDREEPSEDGDRDSGDYEAAGEVRVGLRAWSGPLGHTRKSALYPTPRQSPYCIVSVGCQRFQTRVAHDAGRDPVWNETFQFNLINENDVNLEIKDEEIGLDKYVGMATFTLSRARQMGSDRVQVPVISRRSGREHGFISVSLQWAPNPAGYYQAGNYPTPQPMCGGGLTQPVNDAGLPQPVYGGGMPQPMYDGGMPQPVYGGGMPQTVYGGGMPQPVYGGGMPQPVYGGVLQGSMYGQGANTTVVIAEEFQQPRHHHHHRHRRDETVEVIEVRGGMYGQGMTTTAIVAEEFQQPRHHRHHRHGETVEVIEVIERERFY